MKAPRGETGNKMSSNNHSSSTNNNNNVSDRIKNEIIPLLNVVSTDDEMDELDDEVAMISNKKSQDDEHNEAAIATEEIKLEVKSNTKRGASKGGVKAIPNKSGNPGQSDEEYRNFNTMPRNYSESQ